jgi:hypothetical protein
MNTTEFPDIVKPLIDKVLQLSRAQMTEGDVTAVTYVVNTAKDTMVPVEMHMPNEVSKDVSAALVKWTAKNVHADATIMVSEAWSLSREDAPKYKEILEKYGSLGAYPGKLDILMVSVETREGSWIGRAPIESKGKARRCGPLEVIKAEANGKDGRFSKFLPDEEAP